MSKPVAFAVAAHPDDIELMMAGTLLLLGEAGYELHLMNVADGCCGSATESREATAARRKEEAREAARVLGAHWHPPIARDIEIFYEKSLIARMAAAVREVRPTVMLVQSPQDYMEDHINACRLSVTAAFTRGMPNVVSDPPLPPTDQEVTLYHALPWGLRGPLREQTLALQYVDVSTVLERKRDALACHRSQKEWLDRTQGLGSYLDTMTVMARQVGAASGWFEYAEGWRRHLHLGFCNEKTDPLRQALGDKTISREQEDVRNGD